MHTIHISFKGEVSYNIRYNYLPFFTFGFVFWHILVVLGYRLSLRTSWFASNDFGEWTQFATYSNGIDVYKIFISMISCFLTVYFVICTLNSKISCHDRFCIHNFNSGISQYFFSEITVRVFICSTLFPTEIHLLKFSNSQDILLNTNVMRNRLGCMNIP